MNTFFGYLPQSPAILAFRGQDTLLFISQNLDNPGEAVVSIEPPEGTSSVPNAVVVRDYEWAPLVPVTDFKFCKDGTAILNWEFVIRATSVSDFVDFRTQLEDFFSAVDLPEDYKSDLLPGVVQFNEAPVELLCYIRDNVLDFLTDFNENTPDPYRYDPEQGIIPS